MRAVPRVTRTSVSKTTCVARIRRAPSSAEIGPFVARFVVDSLFATSIASSLSSTTFRPSVLAAAAAAAAPHGHGSDEPSPPSVHVARPVDPSEISCPADQSESSSLLGRALLQPCCACCARARRICTRRIGACRAAHGRGEREGSRLREGRGAAGRGTHASHAVRHEEAAGVLGTDRRRSDQVRPRSGGVPQELREAVIEASGLRRQR